MSCSLGPLSRAGRDNGPSLLNHLKPERVEYRQVQAVAGASSSRQIPTLNLGWQNAIASKKFHVFGYPKNLNQKQELSRNHPIAHGY